MALPSPSREHFEPDQLSATATTAVDQAPALSSSSALARFEFEAGRGNEGTKIIMVEWEDENEGGEANTGDWEVSWEGKSTVLSAREGAEGKLHRIYFLLAPGVTVPRIVKLAQRGGKSMQTNPLPAIFPAELGVSATTAGKKGVLHTVYAKKRLSVLQKEIEAEMKNGEGVGLEMAMQEKQWIEENFGVGTKVIPDLQYTTSPTSPKSPGGGRLAEKLKGLKLGTSASELSSPSIDGSSGLEHRSSHPLSPEMGDVAVSSFALFHSATAPRPSRVVAQNPPEHLLARQGDAWNSNRINSLDAVAGGHIPPKDDNTTEDDLFAVRMSPRSPEMTKSPFSFAAKDTAPWLKSNE
ncbi:Uncharacterized protein BP5553_02107 [Venustampulla echinocandica]|uniref:Uncharacterized protein n=1 Tax=Venustampulla echinocandica TaxID=2656787 RepID=A0A370U2X1_9HELO|nr:Uncharacterized protein BP5553_02107 [Venustampulla echinocandica]RDL42128.1 Uncharacterized protein BP5553_02107 [Venustampulla echinocandica]